MIPVALERCAGLDVHRDSVVACLMWGPANGEGQWEIRKYGTTVPELLRLKLWLQEQGCREVAMESTGAYWEPVFNILSEEWEQQQQLEQQGAQGKLAAQEVGIEMHPDYLGQSAGGKQPARA